MKNPFQDEDQNPAVLFVHKNRECRMQNICKAGYSLSEYDFTKA